MRLYSNRLPGSSFVQPTRACEGLWRPIADMGIVHSDHVYDNLIPAHGNCRIFHMHMNPSMIPTHHICWRSRPGRLLERTRPSPRAITIRNLAGEMCVSVLEEGSLLHHSAPLISSILMGGKKGDRLHQPQLGNLYSGNRSKYSGLPAILLVHNGRLHWLV